MGGDWGKDESFDDPDYVAVRCIRASEIKRWEEEKGQTAALRKIKKSSLEKRALIEGDILVEISGGGPEQPVGRTVLIDKAALSQHPGVEKVCTNFFRLIRPSSMVYPKYLSYFLHSFYKSGKISDYQGGSNNLRNLKFKDYVTITVPLPPIDEQKGIVAKIETLFSELDKGIESLKTARQQLKAYRQAVLKHAFEGKLTKQWRQQNPDKLESPEQLLARIQQEREQCYQQKFEEWKRAIKAWEGSGKEGKKPSKPKKIKEISTLDSEVLSSLPETPPGWMWGKLGLMTCGVEYGTSAKSSGVGDVPVVRMGNLRGGIIDWSDLVFTSDKEEIDKYSLQEGDVLFNRTNSPELVGKTAIYKGEQEALFAGYLIRVNHIPSIVDGRYLNYFLNSLIAKGYGNTVKTDGVNQSNINGEKLQGYPFPFCSLDEQVEIVTVLDEKLSTAEKTLEEIGAQLDKAGALRQSILKKAFSGKFLPKYRQEQ
nr:restriction endonuclease subunit S [Microbulbifer celer]